MTLPAYDNFTRANQTGWGTSSGGDVWSNVLTGGSPTINISSNAGIITGSVSKIVQELGSTTVADVDVVIQFKVTATGDDFGIVLRDDGTGKNHYYLGQHSGSIRIQKAVAGGNTTLFTASFTLVVNTLYSMRFRSSRSNLYGKIWTGVEPGWTVTGTDTTFASAGRFGVKSVLSSTGDTSTITSLTASASDFPPPSYGSLVGVDGIDIFKGIG